MKKLYFLAFILFLIPFAGNSQQYGNEWINYNIQYYRFNVYQDGVYRIYYSTLQSAGILNSNPDPRSFQIFSRGKEVALYVHGENDGVFNNNDYIEFYAEKNDGWLDTAVYKYPVIQPNPNYSLFNDTASYFFTFNPAWITNPSKRLVKETDANFSSYTPTNWFWHISRKDYHSRYFGGETNAYGVNDPDYTSCEGWFDNGFSHGGTLNKYIPTSNAFASGPDAEVQFYLVGSSNYAPLSPDHHVRINFGNIYLDTLYEGYTLLRFDETMPVSQLGSSTTQFNFLSIYNSNNGADRNTIPFIQVKYPHTTDLGNAGTFKMLIPDASQSKTRLDLTNISTAATDTVWIIDRSNFKKIKSVKNGNTHQILIPNGNGDKECFLYTESQINWVTNMVPVNNDPGNYARFKDFTASNLLNSNYIIITHPSLMNDADDYATYRNSTGYISQVVNVEDLYDQFSYGIHKNPLAIRNFIRYIRVNYNQEPGHLFIIGKAYRAGDDGTNPHYRHNATTYAATLVPTYGHPPSDNLLTAGIVDSLFVPAIATGRLSASESNHVQLYLEKVQQYETAQQNPQEWMKYVLHFGGGQNVAEQNSFAAFLNNYKNTIEDTLFGGTVKTFLKTSSAPIQINQSDSLKNLINNGVSLMTFFGHAAGIGFDQSIDHPSEYNNYGRYPFLLANSCFAGDIYGGTVSSSEEFVLIENKGVIGYLASITKSAPSPLNSYSSEFYKQISSLNYGGTVGNSILNTIENIQIPNNNYIKEVCLEMTLHGDPAVALNAQPKPDYEVNTSSVFFDPPNVSTEVDSFYVHVISTNLGRAIDSAFFVELVRTFPGNSTADTIKRIHATYFKDTISFKLPVDVINGIGMNQITITLDSYNEIAEVNELNNTVTVNLFVKSADIVPVFPYKYAVVPDLNFSLKASTGFPFYPARDYRFELDTTDAFNSPVKQSNTINSPGGVISWSPSFPITTDSIVYFWRVSIDTTSANLNWRESSFQFIPNKQGWAQAHFHQFKNDEYQYVSYNKPIRQFEFVNDVKSIEVQTGFYPNIIWTEEYIKLNGNLLGMWCCIGPSGKGFKFAVLDPISGNAWKSWDTCGYFTPCNLGPYGNWHCKNYDEYSFDFWTKDSVNRMKVKNFMDQIPDGHYLVGYSHTNHNAPAFEEWMYQAFEDFGVSQIRTLPNNIPYIFFGIKGDTLGLNTREVVGSSSLSVIQLNDSVQTKWKQGVIVSELIGPASSWGSLHWQQASIDPILTDSIHLSLIGVTLNGTEDTLLGNIPRSIPDIPNLDQFVDVNMYPYIKLVAHISDDSLHTPAQLKRWQVLFDGVPETALDPLLHFHFHSDTLAEAEELVFSTATHNISNYDMDSLLIKYWIIDQNRVMHQLGSHRKRPHPAGDVLMDTLVASTNGLAGLNSLWIEVNPNNDQLEQYHFNNIGEVYFTVESDHINPILDVTFDGIHILDGDLVSARPEIQLMLDDENLYLPLEDTSSFKVFLRSPSELTDQRVFFMDGTGTEVMRFFPATLPDNTCRIEFNPVFPEDGIYNLTIQAQDISRNESGDIDYQISFEVINESTITEVMNYPNPFSTSTRFVFTLTGSEVPTDMRIQIMTITGKVVREIEIDELGPLHIGRNITEFAWDGTDEFGDPLANGVYLYRVISRINGESIKKNENNASQYFTREFGKMYLMR